MSVSFEKKQNTKQPRPTCPRLPQMDDPHANGLTSFPHNNLPPGAPDQPSSTNGAAQHNPVVAIPTELGHHEPGPAHKKRRGRPARNQVRPHRLPKLAARTRTQRRTPRSRWDSTRASTRGGSPGDCPGTRGAGARIRIFALGIPGCLLGSPGCLALAGGRGGRAGFRGRLAGRRGIDPGGIVGGMGGCQGMRWKKGMGANRDSGRGEGSGREVFEG